MLMRGFDDVFMVPHSRHTTVRREDIERCSKLKILASSEQAGVYAMATDGGRQIFITGHSEYDARTLEAEYLRDKNAGLPIHVPENYYPDNDDTKPPVVSWRSHANLLYQNWLNYFVYQTTPYDLARAGEAYAEAAFLNGRPEQALIQLQNLKKREDLDYYARARVDARIAAITPQVLELRRQGIKDPDVQKR